MLSFLAPKPPKTTTATQNPLRTEDGQTEVHFLSNDPNAKYASKTRVKPGHTIHTPPYHWHKYQSETFTVHSGTMRAHLEGVEKLISAGQSVTIAPGLYHTFHNNSDTEPLVMFTGLGPSERDRDEAFFRNLYSYLDDCRKVGKGPNMVQLMLFLWVFDCYPAIPGPRWLAGLVSQVIVFLGGVVLGKWVLGFRESYEEYYHAKGKGE